MTMTEGPIGTERLCEIADAVVEGWHSYLDREPQTKLHRRARAACLYGLAMNNTNLLEFVTKAHREGTSPLLLMPQIRSIYETGITAQWIAQVEDAPYAWMGEGRRQSASLVEKLRTSRSEVFRDAADPIWKARVDYPDLPSKSKATARSFEKICDDIGVGADGSYQYYKLMCAFTHPSVDLADQYLAAVENDLGFQAYRAPKFDKTDAWLYLAVIGTALAQMAFQYSAKDRVLRSSLRAVGKELGIPLDLKPTEVSWLRLNGD